MVYFAAAISRFFIAFLIASNIDAQRNFLLPLCTDSGPTPMVRFCVWLSVELCVPVLAIVGRGMRIPLSCRKTGTCHLVGCTARNTATEFVFRCLTRTFEAYCCRARQDVFGNEVPIETELGNIMDQPLVVFW